MTDQFVLFDDAPALRAPDKPKKGLGCDFCPSKAYWKKGIKPIMGKVRGKKLFIFAQNPGPDENKEGKELIGKSGKWLWDEFEKVGIKREDCDIQNAVRCYTVTEDESSESLVMRTPDKQEIKCCSLYTKEALEKSRAKVYIVFGVIAGKQVCGTEFRKDKKIFWSEKLNAKVYCLDHPSYFVRGGSKQRLKEFRSGLASAANEVKGEAEDPRYAFLTEQDYKWINTIKEAKAEERLIRRAGRNGIRVVFDGEEDFLDEYSKRMPLVMGTCFKPGRVRVFALYHPDGRAKDSKVRDVIRDIVGRLLHDKHIEKAMHHGVHEEETTRTMFGTTLRNFYYDTEFASFFDNSSRFSFGLKGIADTDYPQFSGYASCIMPYAAPKELPIGASEKFIKSAEAIKKAPVQKQYDFFRKLGMLRYGQIPRKRMLWYNGADCDVTKRIEVATKKNVPLALLKIYTDCAWVLSKMEANGPWFDYTHYEKLQKLYPPKLAYALKRLKQIAGKDFNPASHIQVFDVIYNKLKLKYPFPLGRGEKINTQKNTIEFLARTNKFCKHLSVFRKLSKIVSTYLNSFCECAKANNDRLRTKWWLTGTRTGRLSSGGNKEESVDKIVNLQNVHGDPYLQDQCVPDKNWRRLYKYALKAMTKVLGLDLINRIKENANNQDKIIKYQDQALTKLQSSAWEKLVAKILRKFGDTKIFLGFDFGQIEVRVMAQLCGDKQLIKDCESGDIHSAVGHAMTGWPVEKIKKDKKTRTLTKNVHFGIMFGLNAEGVYKFLLAKDPDMILTLEDITGYVEAISGDIPV